MTLVFGVGLVGVIYIGLIKTARIDVKSIGWTLKHFGRNLALGIAGFLGGLVILILFFITGGISELTIDAQLDINIWVLILSIIMGFAIAAWIEQSLMLGYLQPILINKYGYWKGIFLQSLA